MLCKEPLKKYLLLKTKYVRFNEVTCLKWEFINKLLPVTQYNQIISSQCYTHAMLHLWHSTRVLIKRFSGNMQQIYRRTPTPKCDFNKIALQLCWSHTSAWVFPVNLLHIFRTAYGGLLLTETSQLICTVNILSTSMLVGLYYSGLYWEFSALYQTLLYM